MIATTQALSFSFFPPFSTTLVCVCSTVLLEFPNHPQEFPNLPTPMQPTKWFLNIVDSFILSPGENLSNQPEIARAVRIWPKFFSDD